MGGLVLDLQQEVLKPDCDVLNALRKAHLIAVKLQLPEFDHWVCSELNGYSEEPEKIPHYREIRGALKVHNPYHGWSAVQFQTNQQQEQFSVRKLREPLSQIIELSRTIKGELGISLPAEIEEMIYRSSDMPARLDMMFCANPVCLSSIVEQVKNCLLEWTIRLEKEGVIGEGMRFSREETDMAKKVPQTINNYYGTVVNGDIKQSQVVSGSNNTISFQYGDVIDLVGKVKESLVQEQLSTDDRDNAAELISEIETKIAQQKKPGIICAALSGLRDFLVAGGANITAALIVQYLQGLG